jgi:hypothetical protein
VAAAAATVSSRAGGAAAAQQPQQQQPQQRIILFFAGLIGNGISHPQHRNLTLQLLPTTRGTRHNGEAAVSV